jgi:hypothetical protein
MRKQLFIGLIFFVVAVVVICIHFVWSFSRWEPEVFTPSQVRVVLSSVEQARAAVVKDKLCTRSLNHPMRTDNAEETSVMRLVRYTEDFNAATGRFPTDFNDLQKGLNVADQPISELLQLERRCSMASHGTSILLSCGYPGQIKSSSHDHLIVEVSYNDCPIKE